MYIQLLRRDVEPDAIGRLLQETLQTRQREDGFDMGVIESKHQLRGKRPHPVVHDNPIGARRLIYRTIGYIRDRNSRLSGIGRSGRLWQDRKVVRRAVRVRGLCVVQSFPARGFGLFPFD